MTAAPAPRFRRYRALTRHFCRIRQEWETRDHGHIWATSHQQVVRRVAAFLGRGERDTLVSIDVEAAPHKEREG